jgi:hypothetical protein
LLLILAGRILGRIDQNDDIPFADYEFIDQNLGKDHRVDPGNLIPDIRG